LKVYALLVILTNRAKLDEFTSAENLSTLYTFSLLNAQNVINMILFCKIFNANNIAARYSNDKHIGINTRHGLCSPRRQTST